MDPFLTWGLEEQTPEHGSELPTTLKTEEELAKFTVDELLSDTERTVLFLNGGQPIQQKHAIVNLPAVIRARGRQGWESIAGPLKTALNRLDADCQVEAADVFALVAKERLMPPADLQACLLPTIVRNINREKSEEETEAWMRALFELVPMLDKETLRSEVMSMALSKGDMEDNNASRVICARILGNIALYMTKDEVERHFFKRAVKMCQDVDHLVRLSSCQQLAAIGRTAGREAVQKTVLEELFELLKDEDLQVRAAALTSLIQLLDLLTPDVRKARVMPVLRDYAMPFELDVLMQRCIAKNYGLMLNMIKSEMDSDDVRLFYECFKHLASRSDVELRRTCALQIGQVVRAAASAQPTAYQEHFSETFQACATDFDEEVRLTAASQFSEVSRYCGKDLCCQLLTRPLVQLLRDESQRVQAAVLPSLTQTLQQFAADRSTLRQASLEDVVRALTDLEANSARNWRLQVSLASSFPTFHQIFSSDQIYEHFLPMAFRFISTSAAAARPSAAEGIACVLRYNKKDKQRAELFLQLIREYARGKCYTQRLAFAEVCKYMVKRFSSKFVKEWVFDLCLELLYDPVPNVRLQVTYILPSLKQTVRLPEDVDLLERLNNAISNSMTDNDRDVSQTARHINDTYKRMPVRMGGSAGTLIDSSGGAVAAYEAEDKKKEAEETECNFSLEDVKEIKAEIVQMNYKRKPGQANEPAGGKSAINRRADKPGAVSLKSSTSGAMPSAAAKAASTAGPARPAAAAGSPASSAGGRLTPAAAGTAARKPDATRLSPGMPTPAAKAGTLTAAKPGPTLSTASATVTSVVRPAPGGPGAGAAKPGPIAASPRMGVPAPKAVVSTTTGGTAAIKRK